MDRAVAAPQPAACTALAGPLLHLQRKCSCGTRADEGECQSCKGKRLQRRVAVGRDNDPLEAEADHAAETVLATSGELLSPPRLTRMTAPQPAAPDEVPESVQRTLASGGQPLDGGTRAFMERRFGADFGSVRLHQGAHAAQSAADVQARAYTVGTHIVFGAGEIASPRSGLLAHELAHTVQQGGAPQLLQRACLPAAECQGLRKGAVRTATREVLGQPDNAAKAEKRKQACDRQPRDPACTSDGHASPATSLMALLKEHAPSRVSHVDGIYVNKDHPPNPDELRALTMPCMNFTPRMPGNQCVFVPDLLEAEARQYRTGGKLIAGLSREDWLTSALARLVHQTEVARFVDAAPIDEPNPKACKFRDHSRDLAEVAAHLSAMHVYYRDALTKTGPKRWDRMEGVFVDWWITDRRQALVRLLRTLRCHCQCADVDHYVTETAKSVSTDQKWDSFEHSLIHGFLAQPVWQLSWPVKPADSMRADVPSPKAVPFKIE